MILNPRTPFIIGGALIVALAALLAGTSPHPGALTAAHARLEGMSDLQGCGSCHSDLGMATGCLGCHTEIAAQLTGKHGYHHHLLEGKEVQCAGCHQEHNGAHFLLQNETAWGAQTFRGFKHPHVQFTLNGAHDRILCEACHREKLPGLFSLERFPAVPRQQTFLGLRDECDSCHEDIHSHGLSRDCEACHGQESFRPTVAFDHGKHFPLDGGHSRLECGGCHVLPHPQSPNRPAPFPFDLVRGKGCAECHDSPHRSLPTAACEGCHRGSEPKWSSAARVMARDAHGSTGFHLLAPHADVACEACHKPELPFTERYPDVTAPGYRRGQDSCEGCHRDAHEGQFQGRYDRCVDCHAVDRFQPSHFAHAEHEKIYSLEGGHASVACSACHLPNPERRVARYAGTTRQCRTCHDDVHAGQFGAEVASSDCASCHDPSAESFRILAFAHGDRTGYPLVDAHSLPDCSACHANTVLTVEGRTREVRRYRGTPTDCGGCHRDVHRGQLNGPACGSCHTSFATWSGIHFDHQTQTRFQLDGVHARTACDRCHVPVTLPDGSKIVQYKPLGRECTDCHDMLRKE
jgi:hypothetical protein